MSTFDVLMAVYIGDKPILLRRAFESIFLNSVQPTAIYLVIDGELTNCLYEVISYFCDRHDNLFPIHLSSNVGLASALNVGLRYCESEYVMRCDADDINNLDRFEYIMSYLTVKKSLDVLGSQVVEIPSGLVRKCPSSSEEIVSFSAYRNPINHMSVCFRRRVVINVGGYPELDLKEDYGLWLKLIATGAKLENLPIVLVTASFDNMSVVRRSGLRYVKSEFYLYKLRRSLGFGFFRAIVSFFIRTLVVVVMPYFGSFFYKWFFRHKVI